MLRPSGFRFLLPALALMGAAAGLQGETSDDSPFLPAAGPGAGLGAEGPAATYELAGSSITSKGTQVCIYDVQAKRSRWISVGETSDQIQVVSYDPVKDEVQIRANGVAQALTLRKPDLSRTGAPTYAANPGAISVASGQPSVMISNAVPVAPSTPHALELAKQEREARMLVSDLLEIGMQQRKAYEEAARKAAAAKGQ